MLILFFVWVTVFYSVMLLSKFVSYALSICDAVTVEFSESFTSCSELSSSFINLSERPHCGVFSDVKSIWVSSD